MHPDNIRRGEWVRIEDVSLYSCDEESGKGFQRYGDVIAKARQWLEMFGGVPMMVICYQFPYCFVNIPNFGNLMLDLRFLVVGAVDPGFRKHLEAMTKQQPDSPPHVPVDRPRRRRAKSNRQIVQIIVPGAGEPVVRQIDAQ